MDESDMEIAVASAADTYQPEGLRGGLNGRAATAERLDGDGPAPTNGRTTLAPGERIRLIRSTSGGFGDPVDRDSEKIARDIQAGLLSESRAREVYNYEVE
jgi:N-methylhydantoinase B/oxoprolinase/acetone carboxylase alpha subunit